MPPYVKSNPFTSLFSRLDGGGDDDFTNNDTKVFKFQVAPSLYFPFLKR